MEAGLYFPVYCRCFRGGKSIFSLWPLSRFVTKLFIYYSNFQPNIINWYIIQLASNAIQHKNDSYKLLHLQGM